MSALKAAAAFSLLFTLALGTLFDMPPVFHNGSVTVETLSVAGNLDGPKMSTAANKTSFDFWYWDAFSLTDKQALNAVFFNTGDLPNPSPLAVQVSGTFSNGTQFFGQVFATEGAVINNGPDGISGDWRGSGTKFTGTALDKPNVEYVATFNSPEIGLAGTVTLKSRAPAHYPCDQNVPGVTQNLLPHLFWANAVPDAQALIDLTINGTSLKFDGVGYHDKNWGDASVITSPKYWDWGHASIGPYSVVWYDLLDYNNTEHVYSYVAKDGEILSTACGGKALEVRQWDANATYPPTFGIPSSQGLTARWDLGNGQFFFTNLTKDFIVHNEGVYARAVGSIKGGIEGEECFEGKAMYEEFVLGIL